MFLKNHWYIAALGRHVEHALISRRLFGEQVLMYRKLDGMAVAMEDRCIHRRVALSRGKLIGDHVRCGYHGLEYNGSGQCVHIPGQLTIPPQAMVKSYAVVERDGFIWIWAGNAQEAQTDQIPDFSLYASPKYAGYNDMLHVRGNLLFGLENALDLSHVAYVHDSTFSNDVVTEFKAQHSVNGDRVTVIRKMTNIAVPPLFSQVMGLDGNADRSQEVKFWPPNHILLHSTVAPAGSCNPEETKNVFIYANATPETERSYWIFVQTFRDFHVDNQQVSDYFSAQMIAALSEDNAIVEHQQTNWDEDGPDAPMINLAVDSAPLAARRILARLHREQNAGAELSMPWCAMHRT